MTLETVLFWLWTPVVYGYTYVLTLATSTWVVERALEHANADEALEDDDGRRDTGTVIGKLENVLVLTLIFAGAYTALAVLFAAKSLVRIEDTGTEDSTYYLTGTLANFTWATLLGTVAVAVANAV
ncbi:hypothetical protein [Halobacterium jilantaiense]|uniref:Uncharacterized protein n=1 Tax=Halobacterium jilantaiense TaxID=355548 RepID=A0A1I0PVZ3_9EURY|nr:hypothetical protein [Halobacterium jilantaiense]SEW18663.1 hypothetical protein SAMN04487945_2020 [Halobacterium jilantaiense]